MKGRLPEGTSFANGKLTGTPRSSGKYDFTVKVTIDGWIEKELDYSINVASAFSLKKTSTKVGEAYSDKVSTELVTEDAGYANIKYSLVDGAIPEGMTLADDGTISGKATKAGDYTFTINCYAEQGSGWRKSVYNYKETFTIKVEGETGGKDDTASKIAALEKQIADLKNQISAGGDTKALEDKIAALEKEVAGLKGQKSGGCGGSVIAMTSAIGAIALIGAAVVLKKRKEEK